MRASQEDIARSWERSRLYGIEASQSPMLPYEPELIDSDSRICRTARPVLDQFAQMLGGTNTLLVLADREARGVDTWIGNPAMTAFLDSVCAHPGFRWAEDVAGTNGIGTPVETSRPIYIAPGEHFLDSLKPLTCAGVPVRNPLTGRLDAVINLTSSGNEPNPVLLPFAIEIARRVQERLYDESTVEERLLLRHFLTMTRNTNRPIVVVSPEMMLANPPATKLLDRVPQAVLWDHAAAAVAEGAATVHSLSVFDEQELSIRCAPIGESGHVAGVTIEFERSRRIGERRSRATGHDRPLPGLVGRSLVWQRLCRDAHRYAATSCRGVVVGEAGVGKLAVARAVMAIRNSTAQPVVVDAAVQRSQPNWVDQLASAMAAGPTIVTHVDCLSPDAIRAVCGLVDEAGPAGHPLIVTIVETGASTDCGALLSRLGDFKMTVPPLRTRLEDVSDLIPALMARLSDGGIERRCTPEVVQALTRCSWPGNVRELASELRTAVSRSGSGDLRLDALSTDIRRSGVRRNLTLIERAELDTILNALAETSGNKLEAAARLGISRSTLYRKMRLYGFELNQTVY
jgi:transcriptional regulator of acetoin/glycerol metabolism